MNTYDFYKKSERLQLRLSPRTLQRLQVLSKTSGESMAAYIESLINTAWSDQCSIQGYDFMDWQRITCTHLD